MQLVDAIKKNFPQTSSAYYTLGENYVQGILGAGIIYKFPKFSEILKHNYYSAVLLLEGEGIYKDEEHGEIVLSPGSVIQRFPDVMHTNYLTRGDCWLELFIAFGSDLFHSLEDLGMILPYPVLSTGLDAGLTRAWYSLVCDMQAKNLHNLPYMLTRQIDLISQVNSLHRVHHQDSFSPKIAMACDYITKNIDKDMLAVKAANFVDLGYENFRKQFKQQTGYSPNYYIIMQRINLAKSLLADGVLSVNDIAARLSYSDVAIFSKQFKQFTGMTPMQFKKNV